MSIHKAVGNFKPISPPVFDGIPPMLRDKRQHVVWKREERKNGDIGKVPFIAFSALAGKEYRASVKKPSTWSTFTQAQRAYQRGGWDGIGYMLNEDTFLVDLDHCISSADRLDPRAREVIALINSAAEYSPNGDGAHIYALGQLPPGAANRYTYKGLKIEVYGAKRYTTLTGRPIPGTPKDLAERTTALAAFLAQCEIVPDEENTGGVCGGGQGLDDRAQARPGAIPEKPRRNPGTGKSDQAAAPLLAESDLTPSERSILQKAQAAKNGIAFTTLWLGGDPRDRRKADGNPDLSAGDFDLVLILCYWTNDDREQTARLFRASKRYRPEKGAAYLARTIDKAIERRHYKPRSHQPEPPEPGAGQRQPARQDRRITHAHHWTRSSETPEQRGQLLQEAARRVAQEVDEHIRSNCRDTILIEAVPPGVGKTHTVSEKGRPGTGLKLSWIAERRDMAAQVPALQSYRLIDPCTHRNCPSGHLLHSELGSKGHNTMAVHKRHGAPCNYVSQFSGNESTVYQLAHVRTTHPAKADGIIIDELDLSKWLPEREITIRMLTSVKMYVTDSTADRLIRATQAAITDCMQQNQPVHGRAFFEAVNQRTGGHLRNWIGELANDDQYINTHPWPDLNEDDDMAQLWEVMKLAPVVLPHILVAMIRELPKWERGRDWNSCIRIGRGREGWALFITEPLKFSPDKENGLPARVVLDATAPDAEILSLILGEQVEIKRVAIAPPPGTRHIAMRTGKQYGKTSLCATPHQDDGTPLPNRYLMRAVAEIRYLLRELDPDGTIQAAQRVGLVTFKDCEVEIGDELGIPEHRRLHFWAARGSNALADCALLFIVGTPQQNPASLERLARVIWANDPKPIDATIRRDEAGHPVYLDPRMEKLKHHLIRAELTQCAHRSRALREARTVVTLCCEEVEYLPATETIIDMPMLTSAGLDAWKQRRKAERDRLDQARQAFEEAGKTIWLIRVRELRAAAKCSTDTARAYLKVERAKVQAEQARETPHTPPVFSYPNNPVPDSVKNTSYSLPGTKPQEAAAPALPLDPDEVVMRYARAAGYPEVHLPGVDIAPGAGSWGRFMWTPGAATADQRRAIRAYVAEQPPPRLAG